MVPKLTTSFLLHSLVQLEYVLMIFVNVQEYARAYMHSCAALNEKSLLLQDLFKKKKLIGKHFIPNAGLHKHSADLYDRLEVFIFFIVQ